MDFENVVRTYVDEALNSKLAEESETVRQYLKKQEDSYKVKLYADIIRNNGVVDGQKVTMKDLITSSEFVQYFPKVVQYMAGEVFEYQLVVTSLLEEITMDPGPSLVVEVPQFVGAFGQNLDVGENGEYPEISIQTGGGAVATVKVGKAGVAVALTEEAIAFSRFDILNSALNEAFKALARWKEYKAVKMFRENAKVLQNGGSGVDISGTANGGLTLDDILNVALQFMEKGFNMDTIIMHPLAYPIFAKNGTLSSFFWKSLGDKGAYFTWPTLNGMGQEEIYEKMGMTRDLFGRNIASFEVPTGIIGKPLRLILSPAVPFDKTTKKTDVYVLDSANVGYLVTAERPNVTEFADPMRDIKKIRIRERYGIAPKFDGSAIGIIKDVSVVETFDPRPFYMVNK